MLDDEVERDDMPIYSFLCENCDHSFDEFLSIDNRKTPTTCKCGECGNKSVVYTISTMSIQSDSTMNANKKTKGDWNRLMDKMKGGMPKRYHERLDKASSLTGRRFKG